MNGLWGIHKQGKGMGKQEIILIFLNYHTAPKTPEDLTQAFFLMHLMILSNIILAIVLKNC